MPILGNALDFSQYEAKQLRAHQLGTPPSSPVKGQLYYNTGNDTLWWWDGTVWQTAKGGTAPDATTSSKGIVQLAGDLAGTAASPQIAAGVIVDNDVNGSAAIAESKLSLATDAAAGTGSRRTLGSGATQAAPGNDARFTDSRNPTGTAGGDLSGTYPNPQIAAGVITDLDVNAANKDGVVGTASMRTLGAGAQQAMPGNRTLDAIPAPVNPVDVAGQKITSLSTPTASTDAANKLYVDNTTQGLDAKASVKAASAYGVTTTLNGPQTVDGVSVVAGDRVLVKDQPAPTGHGIYVVNAGAWTRAPDMDSWLEVPGAFTWVEQGTTQADTGWLCVADQGGSIGGTGMDWVQFSGAGSIIAGNALAKTGNRLDVLPDAVGIEIVANKLQLKDAGVTGAKIAANTIDPATKFSAVTPVGSGGTGANNITSARSNLGAAGYYSSATHGAGTTITITQATHGLRATRGLIVQVRDETTGAWELPDHTVAASGDVTVTFGASVSANSKRVTIIG